MIRSRRIALSLCFLAGGIGIGTWGANLPALGRHADLSEGELGVVLLFFAAGAVVAMTRAPRIIARHGAGLPAAIAAGLFGLTIMAVGLATDAVIAAVIATLAGVCFGTLDVTMNNDAAAQERHAGRPIMASFHAVFSLGTLISALAYAGLLRAGVDDRSCLIAAGLLIVASAALGGTGLAKPFAMVQAADDSHAGPPSRAPRSRVWLLGGLAFLAFFAEGAILDWIAVFVVRVVGAADSAGALAYAAFASAMTLGRFGGDAAKHHLGTRLLLGAGSLLVAIGFAAVLILPVLPVIIAAMVVCGLGVANLVPILFSESGRLDQGDGGRAMSRVMTMGYAGILIGPAMIGFLAELTTLTLSLWTVVAALVFIGFASRKV